MTPEHRLRELSIFKELTKNPKIAVFDQIGPLLRDFLVLVLLKLHGPALNP